MLGKRTLAGQMNATEASLSGFKIDKTPPTITSVVQEPSGWTKSNKKLVITAQDTGGAPKGVVSYCVKSSSSAPGASDTWITVSGGSPWTTKETYAAGDWYVWVKDSVGNISATPGKKVTVEKIETSLPTITITDPGTAIKASQQATVSIRDTNSGLKSGTYTINYLWTTSKQTTPAYNGNIKITVAASDNATTQAKSGTIPSPPTTGSYYLYVQGVSLEDTAENRGTVTTDSTKLTNQVFKLDKTAPTVTDAVQDPTSWSKSNKRIKITAQDTGSVASGITGWMVKDANNSPGANDSGWTTVSDSGPWFTPNNYGIDTYYVWVKDDVGNVSNSKSVAVNNIETTNPTISVDSNSTAAYTQTATIKIKDANSGLKKGDYKIKYLWATSVQNNPAYNKTTTISVSTDGTTQDQTTTLTAPTSTGIHYLYVQGVDLTDTAGNQVSPTDNATFSVDRTAPTVTDAVQDPTSWSKSNKRIKITAKDTGSVTSAIAGWMVKDKNSKPGATDSGWNTVSDAGPWFTSYGYGAQTWYVYVKDACNNVSDAKSVDVNKIETKPPTISIAKPSTTALKSQKAKISIQDEDSGLAAKKFTIKYQWATSAQNPPNYGTGNTSITVSSVTTTAQSVEIDVPTESGSHYLYVQGVDLEDSLGNKGSAVASATFKSDSTPPTISSDIENTGNQWKLSVTPTLKVTDDTVGNSGVKSGTLEYSWEKGKTTTARYGSKFSSGTALPTHGKANTPTNTSDVWYLNAKAEDNAGNVGTAQFGPFKIDNTAPATTKAPTVTTFTNAATVTGNQTDGESGIDATSYQFAYRNLPNGSWSSFIAGSNKSAVHTFTGFKLNEQYEFKTQVKDAVGNGYTASGVTSGTMQDIPSPTFTLSTDSYTSGNITVTIHYSDSAINWDGKAVKLVYEYRKDDGGSEKDLWKTATQNQEVTVSTADTVVYARQKDASRTSEH